MGQIADLLSAAIASGVPPDQAKRSVPPQQWEAARMADLGQGGSLAEPTDQVQQIQQLVASGQQNPAPDAGGILGPIANLLAPYFMPKTQGSPAPAATPEPTPTPDQPCPDPATDPAGYAICMEQKRAGG